MPSPVIVTLPPTEAAFAPVPSGSPPIPPTFFPTPHAITIQPQATVPVNLATVTIPSLHYSSAAPTSLCVTGCGTDSCAQFGGCHSDSSSGGGGGGGGGSDGGSSSDCGLFGCGGGCSIQGCDTTCGIACGSDQDASQTDAANQPLPTDVDGPDDTNADAGGALLVKPSFINYCMGQLRSATQGISKLASDLVSDPTNVDKQNAVLNAANAAITSRFAGFLFFMYLIC